MLDRSKVLKGLQTATSTLFVDSAQERQRAHRFWAVLSKDPAFFQLIAMGQWPFLVPHWEGELQVQVEVFGGLSNYIVFSIDGSQVYPDRHQGLACYLINIGTAILRYGVTSSAQFSSEPTVKIGGYEDVESSVQEVGSDVVNCQRTELELQAGLDLSRSLPPESVFLFDGSLIFWHLDSKDLAIKNRFLARYLEIFEQFYAHKVLHAGYISMPKSRELVNLIRAAGDIPGYLQKLGLESGQTVLNHLVDVDIARFYLKPGYRTILFQNQSKIVDLYPKHLKPYFFYLNNGTEIARIEIPAWIAGDDSLVAKIVQITLNQCQKGRGYPVCLAEAHEQAVVKGADREFFYHLLQKCAIQKGHVYHMSQKSFHKRGIGI